jgi:hypothetical protein
MCCKDRQVVGKCPEHESFLFQSWDWIGEVGQQFEPELAARLVLKKWKIE